jgi:hypothetical protein
MSFNLKQQPLFAKNPKDLATTTQEPLRHQNFLSFNLKLSFNRLLILV